MADLNAALDWARNNPNDERSKKLLNAVSSGKITSDSIKAKSIQQEVRQPQGVEGIGGVATGIGKGILSTATGLGTLVSTAGSYLPGQVGQAFKGAAELGKELTTSEQSPLSAKGMAEKIGKGGEQLSEWFIPAGAFTKVAKGAEAVLGATRLTGKALGTAQLAARSGIGATEAGLMTGIQEGDFASGAELGAALPIVGKGLSVLKSGASALRSAATGVDSGVYQRIKQAPQAYEDALKHLDENPTQPFLSVATTVAERMKSAMKTAEQKFAAETDRISQELGNARFDLSKNYQMMKDKVKSFRLSLPDVQAEKAGLEVEPGIVHTITTPITQHQTAIINDLLKTVRTAKNVSLDDARNILEKFNTAYNEVPLGGGNKPTKFHAIVMGLKSEFDKILGQAVPELKEINKGYSLVRRVYNKYAPQFIDRETGGVKSGAEQFISNVLNMNKGAQQKNIRALEEMTGVPILDNAQVLKDAQKISNFFPATGSRTQDILRSLGTAGLGTAAGGLGLGTAAAVAASSPKIQGKIAIQAAKLAQKFQDLPDEVLNLLKFISGGSLKDANVESQRYIPGIAAKKAIEKTKGTPAGMSIQDVSGGKAGYYGNIKVSPQELNIPRVSRKSIPESALNEMNDFTSYAMGETGKVSEKNSIITEIRARKIAEKLGINPDSTNEELAYKFGKILERKGYLKPLGKSNPAVGQTALLEEAKKYKNADDFVKAQGEPLLHGSTKKFDEFDLSKRGINEKDIPSKNAFFFTDSIDTAKSYGKNIQERYGKFEKPMTIDADGKMYGDMRDEMYDAIMKAKKDGNDVIIVKNLSDRKDWGNYEPATHYAVLDINKLKTKSQLTDIWKKAHKK